MPLETSVLNKVAESLASSQFTQRTILRSVFSSELCAISIQFACRTKKVWFTGGSLLPLLSARIEGQTLFLLAAVLFGADMHFNFSLVFLSPEIHLGPNVCFAHSSVWTI